MRTFKLGVASAFLFLGACAAGLNGLNATRDAPKQVVLADGTRVEGAQGWCVDTRSSRFEDATAVVVFGSCAMLSGDKTARGPFAPGVMTVSVETALGGGATAEQLEKFFLSETGRGALANDGQAKSIASVQTKVSEDMLFLVAEDKSVSKALSPEVSRAIFDLNGRLVSISLFALSDRPIGTSDSLFLIEEQAAVLREANLR